MHNRSSYWTDTQVDALEVLGAEHAEPFVDNATLRARLHGYVIVRIVFTFSISKHRLPQVPVGVGRW
jgi:hypothetical protein